MTNLEIIKDILVRNLDIDESLITQEATLKTLGVDSLDLVELVCELEERCDIDFGEPENIETVGDLLTHLDGIVK